MNDKTFLWGAATSAHQVEGNNIHSDWWAFEKRRSGDRSGLAADHYKRFADDFALAVSLGHTAHRLSLEWSRIEPAPGQWNGAAVTHYREVLTALRAAGLKSFVTLHHFTNPVWLAQRGGWETAAAGRYFLRYVRQIVQHLGDLVDFWVTLNEPIVYAQQSYWTKRWPPQKKSGLLFERVVRHMAQAHMLAYAEIHRHLPLARVGLAHQMIAWQPARPDAWSDQKITALSSWWFNHRFLALTRGSHDFLGLNYYFSATKQWQWWPPRSTTASWDGVNSDLGWPIDPAGLTQVLLELKRYKRPIYITENGLADADDSRRANFIRDHLRAVERAQAQGADVRGYLHWSFLDNFEWDLGFAPRFGLVAVTTPPKNALPGLLPMSTKPSSNRPGDYLNNLAR
jgi:beta-glucosidase